MGAEPCYMTNAGAVFSLKYHLVWCPKYRRKVLVSPIGDRLKELIAETAEQHGVVVHSMEVIPDHVHLFVEANPSVCAAEVNRFKGRSSRMLRQEFAPLRSRLPMLWSRSCYAGSVAPADHHAARDIRQRGLRARSFVVALQGTRTTLNPEEIRPL